MTTDDTRVEFSRPVRLEQIGAAPGAAREIVATPDECAALAVRLGLEALDDFKAAITLDLLPSGEIVAHGSVAASVVQTCVVTLEPVPARVEEGFEVRFTSRPEAVPRDLAIGPDDIEPPEPLTDDVLDIGELATEQLALALEPWPRLPDAELPAEAGFDPARDGPFAALAKLRANQSKSEG